MREERPVAGQAIMWGATLAAFDFFDQVRAVARHGYSSLSVSLETVARLEAAGTAPRELRAFADGHGVRLEVLEPVVTWLPVDPAWRLARWELDEIERVGDELGISSLCALAGAGLGLTVDETADHFAATTRRFAERGWTTCIEFAPMSGITDLAAAVQLVERAGSSSAVIFDTWHFFRGSADLGGLAATAPDVIRYVQLSDAAGQVAGTLARDTYNRLLPGDGALDLKTALAVLASIGALNQAGPEVITREPLGGSCAEAVAVAHDACERVMAAAGTSRLSPGNMAQPSLVRDALDY
jgi:sugar phosphate isomerase/epimerase